MSMEQHSHTFVGDVAAALLSSSAYTALFYPIHRIKVLIQTQDGIPDVKAGKVARYRFTTSFRRIIREDGMVSLWRGCLPYMLRHVPSTTLSFAFKDGIQRLMPAYDPVTQPQQYTVSRLIAGGGAGVLALACVYPLDLTTIRMAAHLGPREPGMLATMEHSAKGGMPALYRGFWVSATAIGGYKALYFGLYDIAKAYLLGDPSEHWTLKWGGQPTGTASHPHPSTTAAGDISHSSSAGGTAGIEDAGPFGTPTGHPSTGTGTTSGRPKQWLIGWGPPPGAVQLAGWSFKPDAHLVHLFNSWLVASGVVYVASTLTYPLDVVRKRWVLDSGLPPESRQYRSALDCMKGIVRQDGLRGLYRFYGYDMVLRFGGGILLVMYDQVRSGLNTLRVVAADNTADAPTAQPQHLPGS